MSTNTQKNAPVSAEPVAQYYYKVTGCPAVEASDDECICWHDKGTGPHPEAQVGDIYNGFTLTWRRPKPTAPVAAQPDLTQQTLDDVMAGIPARDAEIEALRKEIEALRTQQSADKVSALPPLNDDLIAILGRPNFLCAQLADTLRSGGQEIAKRAENEQAAVIHFLLGHYLADPVQWAEKASAVLKAARKEQA